MASGNYDKRVTIQVSAKTEDDFGQKVGGWSTLAEIWAAVDYGSPGERRVSVAQEQASLPATFKVRRSPLTSELSESNHRISFDGSIWDIEGAVPSTGNMRDKEIIITAKAKK